MNIEPDIFLPTLGKFISLQIQQAVAPLMQTISEQNSVIEKLKEEHGLLAMQIDGMIEGTASEISRVEKTINDLPKSEVIHGKDGKDAEPFDYDAIMQEIYNRIEGEIKKFSVVDGKDGHDGKDADMDALFIYIENYIKAIPIPKDGKDGAPGQTGPAGRDGADVVAAFRDSDRHLVLTLSNGVVKDIGMIHGADGKDGAPGKDGRDGFSLDSFQLIQTSEKSIEFRFVGGDVTKSAEFVFPILIDRGVWRQGDYLKGDVVTYGGSMFIAQCDTSRKPETEDWRLAVKKGLNGSNGAEGPQGKQGSAGRDGRDLTQLGQDGKKWG